MRPQDLKKEIHVVHSCQQLKLPSGLQQQLPRDFVILKVLTAESDNPKKATGMSILLGFDSMATAKDLVNKLKSAMESDGNPNNRLRASSGS